MTLFFNIIGIILSFTIYAVIHSVLASSGVKDRVAKRAPHVLPFYRLLYNIIAIFLFAIFYLYSPRADDIVYELQPPFDILILIPQFLSLAGMLLCLGYFDGGEFLGFKQILRVRKGEYRIEDKDEILELRIEGPYRFSRHPLYFFFILFLGFRPVMSVWYLTSFLCFTAYFIIGTYFEEKRMLAQFGEQYREYQRNVSRIFPLKFPKNPKT